MRQEEYVQTKPYPLNTINFQKIGSTRLGLDVHTLMSVAEKLYTRGFISYPRTETTTYYPNISPKMLLNKLAFDARQKLANQPDTKLSDLSWEQNYILDLLKEDSPTYHAPRPGKLNDNAHPPIHPVKIPKAEDALNSTELRVFELILRHFLA